MPTSGPHEVAFAIRGPIRRADLPGLCDRVCAVLAESTAVVVDCDVAGVDSDAVTVDALARLQLAATTRGCAVRLRNASEPLLELVELMGLTHVLSERPAGYSANSSGSPKRGNSVAVSRKKVSSTMRPFSISSTCSAHGS